MKGPKGGNPLSDVEEGGKSFSTGREGKGSLDKKTKGARSLCPWRVGGLLQKGREGSVCV